MNSVPRLLEPWTATPFGLSVMIAVCMVYPAPFIAVWNGGLDGMIWVLERIIKATDEKPKK